MRKRHELSCIYPVNIDNLWADLLDPQALAESMEGQITYEGLPTDPAFEGQVAEVKLKRWGWLPIGAWTIEVLRRDDEKYILESHEHGGIIRSFRHRLELVAIDERHTRYTDYLDMDAGLMTPLMFLIFRRTYERRQQVRKERLEHKTIMPSQAS